MPWTIEAGEVSEVLKSYADNTFDALACDPPYGLKFMAKRWDYDVPSVALWAECLRVLKPGAPLMAFGGSRTFHRLAVNIEDAGLELRDTLMFLYAKGFPKSLDVGRSISVDRCTMEGQHFMRNLPAESKRKPGDHVCPDHPDGLVFAGHGSALKPAHEPIVLGRKPLDGTMVQNVTRWGVGPLAIDACRIAGEGNMKWSAPRGGIWTTDPDAKGELQEAGGRWPANLLLDEEAAEILDAEVGPRESGVAVRENGGGGQIMSGIGDNPYKPKPSLPNLGYMDGQTNPSRFFFTAKVSTDEREAGCKWMPKRSAGEATDREDGSDGLESPRAGASRTGGARNHHPTLKPIDLTTWLCRLIKPPNPGTILVPFAGTGSEMIGALRAGWPNVVGIERDPEYVEIACNRIAEWAAFVQTDMF